MKTGKNDYFAQPSEISHRLQTQGRKKDTYRHTMKQAEKRLTRMKTYNNQGERYTREENRKEENYPNALDHDLQSSRTMFVETQKRDYSDMDL